MKSYRSFPGLFCILFLALGISSASLALEVPVFSPLRYSIDDVQGTTVYTDTVTMGNILSGEFHLIVQNGSNGTNKVDLAEVSIDGKRLVKMTSKKDFKDKKFKLIKDSELRIQLTGPRGSFVVVSVIAKKLTQVPLVVRMAQADAQAAMTSSLLKINKKPTFASHGYVPTGSVMSQTPQAGLYVKEKTKASITVSTGPAQTITVFPGEPTALASGALVDYDIDDKVAPSEIETITPDVKVARTKLLIAFQPDATVGQMNGLIISINGYITAMLKGVNQVIVRIPDPGTLLALDTLINNNIAGQAFVRYVSKATMPVMASLPPPLDPTHMYFNNIAHHLDVRAHAAWNARSLIRYRASPHIIVADGFGDGPPNADFAAIALDPGDFKTGDLDPHGYHVLGIMAATYGGDGIRGSATGMYPGLGNFLTLSVVDAQWGYTSLDVRQKLMEFLELLRLSHRVGVILNTSLEYLCPSTNYLDKTCIEPGALAWIEQVRGPTLWPTGLPGPESLENWFLHVTAAGNVKAQGDTSAVFNSEWTAAASLSGLVVPETGNLLVNLTNTLVIENRDRSPVILGGTPGCLAFDSKFPGELSAIGENVFSLTGSSLGYNRISGTSMATPQVAGLAAYLWTIKPGLTPAQITEILVRTADSTDCGGTNPRPLIDAYAAVLALDRNYPDMEVRRAILDLNEDRVFNETDVEKFLAEFDTADGAKDYSRYDLNGDGQTGGTETRIFNLDMDYPPTYSDTVHQIIEGNDVSFNENNLTDLEILCFYAYSRLYTGDTDKRKDLLRGKCADPVYVTLVGSISEVYEEACTNTLFCYDSDVLGQNDSYVPVPLPVNIATSCSPYAQSAVTVERVAPDHITVSASMTTMAVREDADPPPCDEYTYMPTSIYQVQGRIMGGRTYTVEFSPSLLVIEGNPSLNVWFDLRLNYYDLPNIYYIECGVYGGGGIVACTTDNITWAPPPLAIDIDVPEGLHYWGHGIGIDSPFASVSQSGQVLSIKPK